MTHPRSHQSNKWPILAMMIFYAAHQACAQVTPNVVVPSSTRVANAPAPQPTPRLRSLYPWKLHIISTCFWIGETPTQNNPTPNDVSSWDRNWKANFGGFDDPNAEQRVISFATNEFRPKKFIPKLNPFYVALPYNDKMRNGHRPEASRVIPWFHRVNRDESDSALKGRWVQVYSNNRSCYAQWEDVGPFVVDDWQYVFGDKRPVNTSNKGAGIDLSPAVRDYLGIPNSHVVHWRFLEDNQVPFGPWKKYGSQAVKSAAPAGGITAPASSQDILARQRYIEYITKQRSNAQNPNQTAFPQQNGR
jgi:hypothetical protein